MVGTIWIKPGMDENAAFMSFGNDKFQRVKTLSAAHLAGKKFGPGLKAWFVNGIGHRPHLEDNGIKPQALCEIENV